MPIYEFHCEQCERDSEVLVRSSDWKRATCPQCGSPRLIKKFSTFASSAPSGAAPRGPQGGSAGGHCCGGGCHSH